MELSKREADIIDMFLIDRNTNTADKIASELKISTKTVYRTIKKINHLVSKELISSEAGKGFSFDYNLYLTEIANSPINATKKSEDSSPTERRMSIIFKLLITSPHPLTIYELYEEHYISDEAIAKDIGKLRQYLMGFQLQLLNRNKMLMIKGSETVIRKRIESLIKAKKLFGDEKFTINNHPIRVEDVNFITEQLLFIEEQLQEQILYPYNINIFSHIYILLIRYKVEGIDRLILAEELPLDKLEKQQIDNNDYEMSVSRSIIRNIESYLELSLNPIESYYLFQHIISSRIKLEGNAFIEKNHVDEIIYYMINRMKQQFDISITRQEIYEDIYQHICSLLYRMKNEISIVNELLPDIRREYVLIYEGLKEVNQELQKRHQLPLISDDEIGFLTLYFAKYNEQVVKKRRVLIMCSSGIGTSELLKVKVQNTFPQIEVVDAISVNQFKKRRLEGAIADIDLIITTINLPEGSMLPSILVNAIFTENDKQNVAKTLEGL